MKPLRFTTTEPMGIFDMLMVEEKIKPLVAPEKTGKFVRDKIKGTGAYIHGDAEALAGFDIPAFIDGNLAQLDLPTEQQEIIMLLPSGEYKCKAELQTPDNNDWGDHNKYYITLKKENRNPKTQSQ